MKHLAPGVIGVECLKLAPTAASLRATEAEYDRDFAALLRGLDPHQLYDELGENAVLLCFCKVGCRCHRRLVAPKTGGDIP